MSRKRNEVQITRATHSAAAMSNTAGTDKERLNLTVQEFGAQMRHSGQEVKDLVKLALKVGALKSGHQLRLADGTLFGRKELNAAVSQHIKSLKQLKKNYTARGTRRKRSALTKTGEVRKKGPGFRQASFLTPELVNFLRTANFGTYQGRQVRDFLAEPLASQYLSRAILTPLLVLYSVVNGHRYEVDENVDGEMKKRVFYRAGPEMVAALGPWIAALEAEDRAKTDAQLVSKNGQRKLRFDRNKFVFNQFQRIIKPGVIPQAALPAEHAEFAKSDQAQAVLAKVQADVSAAKKALAPAQE